MSVAKTYSQKPADVTRTWYIIDAAGVPLGRLATRVATLLVGKQKTTFTPHVDGGDYVVVINAAQVAITGNKVKEFKYRYSGYPGGLTETAKGDMRTQNPEKLVTLAVSGMITTNKLKTERIKRLKVYPAAEHTHAPQKPVTIKV